MRILLLTALCCAACGPGVVPAMDDLAPAPDLMPPAPPPEVRVSAPSQLVTSEGGESVTIEIQLGSRPSADVTLALSVDEPGEARLEVDRVVFSPETWSIPARVVVRGVDDDLPDGDQPYRLVIAPAQSADPGYAGIDPRDIQIVNLDDDLAGFTVTPLTGLETTEAGGTATFSVRLNAQPGAEVVVTVASTSPDEASVSPSQLRFHPNDWKTAQTVTLTGRDDQVDDGDQAFAAALTAQSADPIYAAIDPPDPQVINRDDDQSGVLVGAASATVTHEGDAAPTVSFQVRLRTRPTAPVTIPLRSDPPGEGEPVPATLVFTPGDWDLPRTVRVRGLDDDIDDGDRPYAIVTDAAISDDLRYQGLDAADLSLINIDDDSAGLELLETANLITTEAGGVARFKVRLRSQPTSPVTLTFASANAAEGQVLGAPQLFDATNWWYWHSVEIKGVEDDQADGDQTFMVRLVSATSSDTGYHGRTLPDVSVLNYDSFLHFLDVRKVDSVSVDHQLGTLSADGRFLTYGTRNDGSGGSYDVRQHDLSTAQVTRINVDDQGSPIVGYHSEPVGSDDGAAVAFITISPLFGNAGYGVFLRDLSAGTTSLLSGGTGGATPNGSVGSLAISGNGRFVAFSSTASNLVAGDTNGLDDVFLVDRQTGTRVRASVGPGGRQLTGSSYNPQLSGDGSVMSFESDDASLVPNDDNQQPDLFVRDLVQDTVVCANLGPDGKPGPSGTSGGWLSRDGRLLAFTSRDPLLAGDTNGSEDIYVFDRVTLGLERVSAQVAAGTYVYNAHLSPDGRYVAFGAGSDTWVFDRQSGQNLKVELPVTATGNLRVSNRARRLAFTVYVSTPNGNRQDVYIATRR